MSSSLSSSSALMSLTTDSGFAAAFGRGAGPSWHFR
jgi:hypothetical protein